MNNPKSVKEFHKTDSRFQYDPKFSCSSSKASPSEAFSRNFSLCRRKTFFFFPFSDLKNVFWTSVLVKFDVDGNRSRFLAPILKRWKRKITLWRPKSKISVDANFFCPLQESQRRDSPEKRWLSLLEMFNGFFSFVQHSCSIAPIHAGFDTGSLWKEHGMIFSP